MGSSVRVGIPGKGVKLHCEVCHSVELTGFYRIGLKFKAT